MTPEEVEDLLRDVAQRKSEELPTRYGSPDCPQAWRFVDAQRNPWTLNELAHFDSGCPFCSKTREMLARSRFVEFCPALSGVLDYLGSSIRSSSPLHFINNLSELDWANPFGITHLNLEAAIGVSRPLHFGDSPVPSQTDSAAHQADELRRLAAAQQDESVLQEVFMALAAGLRNPEKGISQLKSLPVARDSVEGKLLLALYYHQLGSQEDVEAQIQKALDLLKERS